MNINIELGTGLGWGFRNPFSYTTWQIIAVCSKVISIAMHFEANILESKAKGAKDRINYGLLDEIFPREDFFPHLNQFPLISLCNRHKSH